MRSRDMTYYLALEKVRRQDSASVAVEKGESCTEGRGGDTPEDSLCDHSSPTRLGFMNSCNTYVSIRIALRKQYLYLY